MTTDAATLPAREPAFGPLPRAYEWVSGHLFYHGNADIVLRELAGPLTDELLEDTVAQRFFFLRYWEGGGHLRLRVLPTAGNRLEVMARMRAGADHFFRRWPSEDDSSIEDYPAFAAQLAAAEGRTEYAQHPYPNNSLHFIPYAREHGRYGEGRSMAAVENHFVESSRIALDLVRADLEPRHRDTLGFLAMLTCWLGCEPDPVRLRAHLSRWGYGNWRPAGTSPVSDEDEDEASYRRQADRLLTLANRALILLDQLSGSPASAPRPELAERSSPGSGAAAGKGAASTEAGGGDVGALAQFPGDERPVVRWAREIVRLKDTLLWIERARRGTPNGGHRGTGVGRSDPMSRVASVLDLCTHLFCNRIGITVFGEHQLRQLAIRTVIGMGEARR